MSDGALSPTPVRNGSGASFETEDGGQLGPAAVSLDDEMTATVDLSVNNTNEFRAATISAKAGVLSIYGSSDAGTDYPLTNLRIQKPTNERDERPWCLKMSLVVPMGDVEKYILDTKTEKAYQELLIGLQDRITARLDVKSALAEVNQTNGENYPNMTFIPLKLDPPAVPGGEFALFLILLTVFMFNLSTQDFENDFQTTDSLKGMTGWTQFNKISTVDDYLAWWPVLLVSLKRWVATREGWLDRSIDLLADEQVTRECDLIRGCTEVDKKDLNFGAVLLGHPFITQTRKLRFGVKDPPPFNASGSQQCEWELFDPLTSNTSDAELSCYGSTRMSPNGHSEYYIRQMQGILNGTYDWTPANWISADTMELSHQFTLYFPSARKFAVVRIWVSIDQAGRVRQLSLAGNTPSFEVYEPFLWESDPRFVTLELLFYVLIVKMFIGEIFEIWECICYTDTLLPLKVLTASLDLQLHEIMYFHERASQVYDPRDPKTEKAFKFPDLADLETHMNGRVKECENVVEALEGRLLILKNKMASSRGKTITKAEYEGWRSEMVDLQLKLTQGAEQVAKEEHVAAVAAMLQLGVMWANDWSFDFPDRYLAQLGDDASVPDDGLQAFCDVNWIAVSRAYLAWCDESGHESNEIKADGGVLDIISQLTFKVTNPFAGRQRTELEKAQYTAQHKHFEKLAPLVDYLDMLHDVLALHTQLVTARQIKRWEGPRGAELGTTVCKAFQGIIADYNRTGKRLKEEMQSFPEEIADGFSEPDQMKAETIRIKAKALIREIQSGVETCGMLGLFFPGSVMWELQRKTQLSAKYDKSRAFRNSVGAFGKKAGKIVSESSMKVYVRQAEVADNDDGDETINPVADSDGDEQAATSPRGFTSSVYEAGTPGWRTWIPKGAEQVINYDGQFVVPHDKVHQWMSGTGVVPMFLWFKSGLMVYLSDTWNQLEFISSISFMYSFYSKVRMLQMADALDAQREVVQSGQENNLVLLDEFSFLSAWYMKCLALNALLMWCKLFNSFATDHQTRVLLWPLITVIFAWTRYIGVIPQMGVLLKVLSRAGPSVMIFTIVAMVPCVGLSLSYHVVFGAVVKNYSSPYMALNSVMRMAVGDFDFMEIYSEHPLMSLLLFWVSSLLIVMVLINIFIAIIMSAYDAVLSQNPDAADASSFGSMVMLQITRLIKGATGIDDDDERYAETDVHVLQNTMDRIEDEAYWDIFEGYFDLPSSDDEPEEDEAEEEAEEVDPDLQSLARDVAAIKKSQHEQAKQMGDVVSQLNELKELLRAVLK